MTNPHAGLTPRLDFAGLTPRLDLLEALLRPLEQLPGKDQFFAFLTKEDGRVIPVSGLAYSLVSLVMLRLFHVLTPSAPFVQSVTCRTWCTCLTIEHDFVLQTSSYEEANRFLVQGTSSTLSHTSGQIELTPDHGAEHKTTSMMTNLIPLVIRDVLKVHHS